VSFQAMVFWTVTLWLSSWEPQCCKGKQLPGDRYHTITCSSNKPQMSVQLPVCQCLHLSQTTMSHHLWAFKKGKEYNLTAAGMHRLTGVRDAA